jgi:hypothetical protein
MRIATRLNRRLVTGIGLASAAILLPTAALASTAGAGRPAVAAATCTSAHTRVWYAEPTLVGLGHSEIDFEISNIGRTTCSFRGYPGISALDSHGNQVGLPATHGGGRVTVTLAPGGTSHVILSIADAHLVCSHPRHASELKVFPPGQFHAQIVRFASLGCPGKSVMAVDSVRPGAGIPGYSVR